MGIYFWNISSEEYIWYGPFIGVIVKLSGTIFTNKDLFKINQNPYTYFFIFFMFHKYYGIVFISEVYIN